MIPTVRRPNESKSNKHYINIDINIVISIAHLYSQTEGALQSLQHALLGRTVGAKEKKEQCKARHRRRGLATVARWRYCFIWRHRHVMVGGGEVVVRRCEWDATYTPSLPYELTNVMSRHTWIQPIWIRCPASSGGTSTVASALVNTSWRCVIQHLWTDACDTSINIL